MDLEEANKTCRTWTTASTRAIIVSNPRRPFRCPPPPTNAPWQAPKHRTGRDTGKPNNAVRPERPIPNLLSYHCCTPRVMSIQCSVAPPMAASLPEEIAFDSRRKQVVHQTVHRHLEGDLPSSPSGSWPTTSAWPACGRWTRSVQKSEVLGPEAESRLDIRSRRDNRGRKGSAIARRGTAGPIPGPRRAALQP